MPIAAHWEISSLYHITATVHLRTAHLAPYFVVRLKKKYKLLTSLLVVVNGKAKMNKKRA